MLFNYETQMRGIRGISANQKQRMMDFLQHAIHGGHKIHMNGLIRIRRMRSLTPSFNRSKTGK